MAVRAVYHKGANYGDENVLWVENDVAVDLVGWDIELRVFPFGGSDLFAKTTGLTTQTPALPGDPNLVVEWEGATDLDLLEAGTYVQFFTATLDDSVREMFGELIIRENAPNAAYCEIDDLLLGDIELHPNVNRYTYMNNAADEINSRLGYIYELPLMPAEGYTEIATTSLLLLKNINAKLASGRLLCAIATGGEEDSVHAYGLSLIQEAWAELQLILNGSLPLLGVQRSGGDTESPFAETTNVDSVSGVDTFYEEFFGIHWAPFPVFGGVWQPNE